MPSEITIKAADPKAGMSFRELAETVKKLESEGKEFRVKGTTGFGSQLKSVTFVEVENVPEG